MSTHRRSIASCAAILLLAVGASPVAAAPPHSISGWVVVRDPTNPSYTPAARDKGNSAGGTVTVARLGTGQWEVTFGDIDAHAGNVQVSPLGNKPRVCMVWTWGGASGGSDLQVHCFKPSGAPVDTPFAATITQGTGGNGGTSARLAYLWNDLPDHTGTPDTSYQYSSSSPSAIKMKHLGTGAYSATWPHISSDRGTIVLSAYQGGSETRVCAVADRSAPAGLSVSMVCRDLSGARADAEFNLLFARRLGLEGFGGGPAAYLRADKPAAASYHPNPRYAYSSAGQPITVKHLAPGVYQVTLAGMPAGGAAIVSTYGSGSARCQIGSIRTAGSPQKVSVRCFAPSGSPANSAFTLSYTK